MKKLALMFLSIAMIACKGGGGGVGSSAVTEVNPYGVYQICEYDSDSDMSSRSLIYLNGNLFTETITYYLGANCQAGSEVFDERYIYSYSKTGTNYRIYLEGLTSTSLNNGDLNFNNTNSYCGYNNWVLNVPKNILGRDCAGTTLNQGDFADVTAVMSGTNLVVTSSERTVTYTQAGAWNFSPQGQTIANGNWAYFDGGIGAYLVTNNGSYTMTYFDPDTQRYFTENGTYTSSNNVMNLTVVSYVPDCGNDEGTTETKRFAQTSFSLAVEGVGEDDDVDILLEKVPYTQNQFRDAYLGAGYLAGCF